MKIVLFMGLFFIGCVAMPYSKSDHFDGKRFYNPWGVNNEKSFWDVLKWKWTTEAKPWHDNKSSSLELPARLYNDLSVTWVNHSTFLIRTSGLNILTDPIWSERTSPITFAGPKRIMAPGISWKDLPKIDLVLVSHNHYDHLDMATLEKLSKRDQPLFLVPLGDGEWLSKRGIRQVEEMDWWQTRDIGVTQITFLPAQHWSARWTWDKNESLWGSWGIARDGLKIYHAGDTGLGPHFKQIRQKWGRADLALLPIGAYEPRWFMKDMHMNPADAVEAFKDLEAKLAIGMHFGTFPLTDEPADQPLIDLAAAVEKANLSPHVFRAPKAGETFTLSKPRP